MMKINHKKLFGLATVALSASALMLSCTDGFDSINTYPYDDPIPVIGGGGAINTDDIVTSTCHIPTQFRQRSVQHSPTTCLP